jgi:hypothetical protein
MYLCPNEAVVVSKSIAPVIGNNIMGRSAVTDIGTDSVTHHKAIHKVIESKSYALSGIPTGGSKHCNKTNSKGPEIKKTLFCIDFIPFLF